MPEVLRSDDNQQMEQPNDGLSEVTRHISFDAAKNLSDMSFDVVGLIIERSDYKKQSIRRKTSKSLRALVDEQKPALQSSRISCYRDFIECSYNDSL